MNTADKRALARAAELLTSYADDFEACMTVGENEWPADAANEEAEVAETRAIVAELQRMAGVVPATDDDFVPGPLDDERVVQ